MPRCETCGNEHDKPIEIVYRGRRHFFDSFECAVQKMAPTCANCGHRIIGHGIEAGDGVYFCCARCARRAGHGAADRVA